MAIPIWLHCRIGEFFDFYVTPSLSRGHGLLDGALAMSARRHKRSWFRLLIEAGAYPHVAGGLPLKEAAASGDATLARWLLSLKPVPSLAASNARIWAEYFGHSELAREIAAFNSNNERLELASMVPTAQAVRLSGSIRL